MNENEDVPKILVNDQDHTVFWIMMTVPPQYAPGQC
jgi:hypothetical protein